MAANTNSGFLTTDELDFQAYRNALKVFLSQQPQFQDYDFDGSNLSVLLDVLAYNTYLNGTYLNLIGSEMFLDTSIIRESIVSHAKELNYTPGSKASAVAQVDISVSGNNLPAVLTIPKNYRVTGRASNGQIFTFMTAEAINIGSANNYTANAVNVYEGRLVKETFVANSTARYVLSSANVDINSISVMVQNSQTDTTNTVWNRATTLFGTTSESQVFFVQGYEDFKYELVFGNGLVGAGLTDGNIVRVEYRDTKGDEANGVKAFSAEQSIEGFTQVTVNLTANSGAADGGAQHEADEDIKFNAPRYFSTQERCITPSDFVTLVGKEFPQLEAITAYGGEDNEPKMYGKAIVSAKPKGSTIMSNSLKDQILKFLRNKTSLSIDPIIVDPDFYNVTVSTEVTYNINDTTKTPTELQTAAQQAILNFNEVNLSDFGSDLRYSKLLRAIDDADESFISNDTDVLMTKKLYPILGKAASYNFTYGNRIATPGAGAVITSSPFGFRVGTTVYSSFIEDDALGGLTIYTIDATGQKVVLSPIGSVQYSNGKIVINSLIVENIPGGNSLKIYAKLMEADVETTNNKILLIEPEDIRVTVVGIRE